MVLAVCTVAPLHGALALQCPGALGRFTGQVQHLSHLWSWYHLGDQGWGFASPHWTARRGRGALCHDLLPHTAMRKRGCLQGRDFPNSSLAPFSQGSPPYPLLLGLLWHQQPLLSFPTWLYSWQWHAFKQESLHVKKVVVAKGHVTVVTPLMPWSRGSRALRNSSARHWIILSVTGSRGSLLLSWL